MRVLRRSVSSVLVGAAIALACSSDDAPDPTELPGWVECTDPRPEMCTRDYRPVCGLRDDGELVTGSNGCTACSDPRIRGHRPGACPGDS